MLPRIAEKTNRILALFLGFRSRSGRLPERLDSPPRSRPRPTCAAKRPRILSDRPATLGGGAAGGHTLRTDDKRARRTGPRAPPSWESWTSRRFLWCRSRLWRVGVAITAGGAPCRQTQAPQVFPGALGLLRDAAPVHGTTVFFDYEPALQAVLGGQLSGVVSTSFPHSGYGALGGVLLPRNCQSMMKIASTRLTMLSLFASPASRHLRA